MADERALVTVAGVTDESELVGPNDLEVDLLEAIAADDVEVVHAWARRKLTHLEDRDEDRATALVRAARDGSSGTLALLINLGANVDATTEAGATGLMVASQEGHTECVRLLLEARAGVDARSRVHHATALHLACRDGHTECARLLALGGAALNDVVKTSELFGNGATALSFAVFNSHREIEFLLRQLGAPDAPLTRDALRSVVEWTETF
eukprot:g538.t1